MEILYLLGSFLSTSLTSLALSLLLPFTRVFRRFSATRAATDSVSLYQGTVWHERRRPIHHSFRYDVRYALVDLDRAPHAPPDHLSASQARSFSGTNGPVLLLTMPPSVGYEQNPLSVYYCYDVDASSQHLKKCIAEVTNTPWGERVMFLFNPESDMVAKTLHVSPFNDMLGSWKIKTNTPGETIFVTISVSHPTLGDYFSASLVARRMESSTPVDHTLFFWLMPHKVAFWIYWQRPQPYSFFLFSFFSSSSLSFFLLLLLLFFFFRPTTSSDLFIDFILFFFFLPFPILPQFLLFSSHFPSDLRNSIQIYGSEKAEVTVASGRRRRVRRQRRVRRRRRVSKWRSENEPSSNAGENGRQERRGGALKLWWKGVRFVQHPRYYNPRYRKEAVARDEEIRCCQVFASNSESQQESEEEKGPKSQGEMNARSHCFTWRDAKWPWN